MKTWIHKNKWSLIAALTGGIAGYLYYQFVGCKNGNCLIVSRPYIIVPYGALLAFLLAGSFTKKPLSKEEKS